MYASYDGLTINAGINLNWADFIEALDKTED